MGAFCVQWFTNAKITELTPNGNDVVFDVHESDCGASGVSVRAGTG